MSTLFAGTRFSTYRALAASGAISLALPCFLSFTLLLTPIEPASAANSSAPDTDCIVAHRLLDIAAALESRSLVDDARSAYREAASSRCRVLPSSLAGDIARLTQAMRLSEIAAAEKELEQAKRLINEGSFAEA